MQQKTNYKNKILDGKIKNISKNLTMRELNTTEISETMKFFD